MESTSYGETSRARAAAGRRSVGAAIVCASTVTQARPSAIVIACGLPPTAIVAIGLSVAGSMRVTVPSPLLATHTEPAPTRHAGRGVPDRDRRRHRPGARVDPDDLVVERVGDPHAALADRDPARPMADGDRRHQPGGVDPDHVVGVGVGQPDGAGADSDPRRAGVRVELLGDAARRAVQPRQQPEDGATQSVPPPAATAPGPPGTTLPIRAVRPIASNSRVDAADRDSLERPRWTLTTHTRSVGGRDPGRRARDARSCRSVRSVLGRSRETV